MIVASFEYSVIIMVNDVKFTAAIWRPAWQPIETVANEASMYIDLWFYRLLMLNLDQKLLDTSGLIRQRNK